MQHPHAQRREVINGIRVADHLGLVRMVSNRYRGAIDADDAMQAGVIGLMRAAEKFDPTIGAFSTYAVWWIRRGILREIHDRSRTVRVSVHRWEQAKRVPMPPPAISLDAPHGTADGDSTRTLLDSIAYPDQVGADEAAIARQRLASVREALALLDPRRRIILLLHAQGDTLEEIGSQLKSPVCRERVRQLKEEGLRMLGAQLQAADAVRKPSGLCTARRSVPANRTVLA